MKVLYEDWTDHHVIKFIETCGVLKCGQSNCDELEGEARARFIQAFYPEYDPNEHMGVILKNSHNKDEFPTYHIVVMTNSPALVILVLLLAIAVLDAVIYLTKSKSEKNLDAFNKFAKEYKRNRR